MVDIHTVLRVLLSLFTLCPRPSFLHGTSPGIIASTQCVGSCPCKRWVWIVRARLEAGVDLTLALGRFCFWPRWDGLSDHFFTQLVPSPYLLVKDT